jgi:GNAT superfamily N-acetyltransferase
LVAEHDGRLAGFKIGYEVSADEFYSWVGGVIPEFRMRHLAVSMLEAQERWAARNGYNKISVKTESRFPAMLQLLLTCGYRRVGTEEAGGKLLLERTITQK